MNMENLCHGCLSRNRKLIEIDHDILREMYTILIDDKKLSNRSPVTLCWECSYLLKKFFKFKRRLHESYNKIRNFSTQINLEAIVEPISSYKQETVIIIDYDPNKVKTETIFTVVPSLVKPKQEPEITIKTEYIDLPNTTQTIDNVESIDNKEIIIDNLELTESIDFSDGDDTFLIDLKNNTKTDKNRIKKVKKKEKNVITSSNCYRQVLLNKAEIKEERKMLSMDSVYADSIYKCTKCIVAFSSQDDFKEHEQIKHNLKYEPKCHICERTFSNEISYNYHMNRHKVRYECVSCYSRFPTRVKVVRHFESCHCVGRKYRCEVCLLEFESEIELCIHKPTHNQPLNIQQVPSVSTSTTPADTYPCTHCDKQFKWRTSLNKHMERHRIASGLKRKPYCEICKLTFTQYPSLRKHEQSSSKHRKRLKERQQENKGDVTPSDAAGDVAGEPGKYCCPLCDKRFQWKGNLHRHVSSHAARAAGQLECVPCSRTFSSIATYKQHLKLSRKHVKEDDFEYKCTDCDKKFVSKPKLKDHIDWEHLKNYVHTCTVCQKVFKSHTSLYLHKQVVHKKGSVEHLCDHCGKSFPNSAKLRTHQTAVHTSDAPYKCSECGATFSWHSCLSRHVRVLHKGQVN